MKNLICSALLTFSGVSIVTAAEPTRPNIIFVLTDDLGWGDVGVYFQNSRHFATNRNLPAFATPQLDRLAAQGLRMNNHYCPAPVCAPSRASFLLGVHQGHANVRDNQFDKALADTHTVGTVLKQAGYATAALGKWGLQGGEGTPAHPQKRGFDYFFGYMAHVDAHFHYPKEQGRVFYENTTDIAAQLDLAYSTDLIAARAKKWIVDHRAAAPAQPFFMYLCFAAPHAQLNVPSTAYPAGGGLEGGVQWTGKPGAVLNTSTGVMDSWIHPDYAKATWDEDRDPATAEKPWPEFARRHATMVRRLDDAMGDLLKLLTDLKIDGETLVVFTSDNGPHAEAGRDGRFTQDPQFFRSYGPLDGTKRDVWEGGIRVPTLVYGPGLVPAGRVSTHPSQFHDWMSTFAELAGVPAPAASDGVSLVPDLTGKGTQREGTVYVEYTAGTGAHNHTKPYTDFHPSHAGAARGQMQVLFLRGYKGVRTHITAANTLFRVYEVVKDPQETTDLAGQPGAPSQAEFEAGVLQVRRVESSARRVYDTAPVPAATPTEVMPGLRYSVYEGDFPWVPDFTGMATTAAGQTTGISDALLKHPEASGVVITAYLAVSTAGTYTFYLRTDADAFVRLHEARLIDADFGYVSGQEVSSGNIVLSAGLHPIRIHLRNTKGSAPQLNLSWEGPQITKQPIPEECFFTTMDGRL